MRVLVTGAGGYVGRAVVAALSAADHDTVAMVHRSGTDLPAGTELRVADLLDRESLEAAVAGVDAVCHLAALTRVRESWEQPLRYFETNMVGTLNLLAAMESRGVDQLVFASTGAIYGSPERQPMTEDLPDDAPHPYGASKLAAELAIEAQARSGRLGAAILRVFGVAGGADPDASRIVPRVIGTAAGDFPNVTVNGDGSAMRDLLHVDDAAQAFVAALGRCPKVGETRRYNIGTGVGTSVADVIAAAEHITGRQIPVVHNPPAAEPAVLVCDSTRARDELEWKPARSELDSILRDAWLIRSARGGVDT